MAKKNTTPTKVESIRHKDKRKNIPTEELRDFVAEDEHAPKTMLYQRDPSLDPQLVWKGKDEQDRQDLAVPVVPIYIQEKIHPQAIINGLPRTEQPCDNQFNLFADFNGLDDDFAKKIEFYQHEQNWTNRMILGDSLLVMTSLAEKEGLKGGARLPRHLEARHPLLPCLLARPAGGGPRPAHRDGLHLRPDRRSKCPPRAERLG